MKILFNEIVPKNAYFLRHAHWGLCFFNIVAPEGEGGHKIFDHQIGGGHKNIA